MTREDDNTFKISGDSGQEPAVMITNAQLCALALGEALRRQGVADPEDYLKNNEVESRVWFHPEMGATVLIVGARLGKREEHS